jgi:hypothetical protein
MHRKENDMKQTDTLDQLTADESALQREIDARMSAPIGCDPPFNWYGPPREAPLVAGGQGRDGKQLETEAAVLLWITCASAICLVVLVALAAWISQ